MNNAPKKDVLTDTLIILNSFIHDMTTGIWAGSLFVMKAVLLKAGTFPADTVHQFADGILIDLWTLSLFSFAVMIMTGAARVFTLKNYGWTGDSARERKRLLVVKHVILGIIVSLGLIMQIQIYRAM